MQSREQDGEKRAPAARAAEEVEDRRLVSEADKFSTEIENYSEFIAERAAELGLGYGTVNILIAGVDDLTVWIGDEHHVAFATCAGTTAVIQRVPAPNLTFCLGHCGAR
jgi:hypothetical protein